MRRKLGIIGTSGFAREAADMAVELGYCPVFIAIKLRYGAAIKLGENEGKLRGGAAPVIGIGLGVADPRVSP